MSKRKSLKPTKSPLPNAARQWEQDAADIEAAITESEERLKTLAARLPGGTSRDYIAVICEFLASQYGWGLHHIAGLDNTQMTMLIEQALRREAQTGLPVPPQSTDVMPGLALRRAARHSIDYRSVFWYGSDFTFTKNQASIVRLLWEAWENHTPEVGMDTLLSEADCDTKRLDHLFDMGKHPALEAMIRPGSRQGSYRLFPPQGE